MVATVVTRGFPTKLQRNTINREQLAQWASQPKIASLNTMNGLSNTAKQVSAPRGNLMTKAVMTLPKNTVFAQSINVRAVTTFNQQHRIATAHPDPDKGSLAHPTTPSNAKTPQQKIMTTLAFEAMQQMNKRHLLKPGAEKRSARPTISPPMLDKQPTSTPSANTCGDMLTKSKAIVDSAVTEFGIVEKGVADPTYARQVIDSALCTVYSTHKDHFMKRLEQSAEPVQNDLFNTLTDDTKQEIRQALSGIRASQPQPQPQQENTKIIGMLDTLERMKDTPFVKAFGARKVLNILQKGIVKASGRSLFKSSLQEAVASAYQKGRNASLATGSLRALDAVTSEITQQHHGAPPARISDMPYPHTAREIVTHQAVLNHLLKTKGHARDKEGVLSTAAEIAYHRGLCDGIRAAYLHTIGSAALEVGLGNSQKHNDDETFTPTGAGANPFITPMLDAVNKQYPGALQNPEIKEQLSKHAHARLMTEIETLSKNMKAGFEGMSHHDVGDKPSLKDELQGLMKYSPNHFSDSLTKISIRYSY